MGFDYQRYLASREWALLREQVRERSGNKCERCGGPYQSTHHLTYERIGHELLEDLQAVCNPCHEFLSGKRDDDPARPPIRLHVGGMPAPCLMSNVIFSPADKEWLAAFDTHGLGLHTAGCQGMFTKPYCNGCVGLGVLLADIETLADQSGGVHITAGEWLSHGQETCEPGRERAAR